jgi:hypothetical protein
MTTFLTYSIYSINTSNSIPQQSDYVPAITIYYITSTIFTLIAFTWFIMENFFRSRGHLPWLLNMHVNLCRRGERILDSLFQVVRKQKVSQQKVVDEVMVESENQTVTRKLRYRYCMNCEKCEACEEKAKKTDEGKARKAFEDKNIDYLNHQIFWLELLCVIASNISIWIYLSN